MTFIFSSDKLDISYCNLDFVPAGLPADTLSGHRDRFYTQYRT